MSDQEWESYACEIESAAATVVLDLALAARAPVEGMAALLWVWVYLRAPDAAGQATEAEEEALYRIEDMLVATLAGELKTVFAGRVTSCGCREFYFYAPSGEDLDAVADAVMAQFRDYKYSFGGTVDPEWSHYFSVLFPDPVELQTIRTRRALEHLLRAGDPLSEPRDVSHVLYFPTPDARAGYAEALAQHGFRVTDAVDDATPGSQLPFGLQVTRSDSVEPEGIQQISMTLFLMAAERGGIYHGWQCPTLTPP